MSSNKSDFGKTLKSLVVAVATVTLVYTVYLLPLTTQIPDVAHWFLRICRDLTNPGDLAFASMAIATIVSLLGWLVFRGWRVLAWCGVMLIFTLAIFATESARRRWSIWHSSWEYSVIQSYLFEMGFLGLLPLQVWLWRRREPVASWARASLCIVAAVQGIVTVTQFMMLRAGQGDKLIAWGIASANLYTPRDSESVYSGASRLTGLVNTPIVLGMVLTLTWPALLSLSRWKKLNFRHVFIKGIGCILIVICVWAIVLTYTRAAYFGLAIQCFAIAALVISDSSHRRKWILNLAFVLIGVASALLIVPSSTARVAGIGDIHDASLTNRLAVYRVAVSLLGEHPFSGWGPGFFNILYNRFYRLWFEDYAFFNVHSAVLNTFMEIGLGGILLFSFATCGFRWQLLCRKLPVWAWLGPLGVFVPLCADNPTCYPVFLFPLMWILGVWVTTSISLESKLKRIQSAQNSWNVNRLREILPVGAVALCLFCWLISYSKSTESPNERFLQGLRSNWNFRTKKLSFYVHDNVTNRIWKQNENAVMPEPEMTSLAIAAALIESYKTSASISSTEIFLENTHRQKNLGLLALPVLPEKIAVGNALFLMLAECDDTCIHSLHNFLGEAHIESVIQQLVGRTVYFRPHQDSKLEEILGTSNEYRGPGFSAKEACRLMEYVVNSTGSLSVIARSALKKNQDVEGLRRYLDANSIENIYSAGGASNGTRGGVMLCQNNRMDFTICVMSENSSSVAGIDNRSSFALAKMGWKSYLFLAH